MIFSREETMPCVGLSQIDTLNSSEKKWVIKIYPWGTAVCLKVPASWKQHKTKWVTEYLSWLLVLSLVWHSLKIPWGVIALQSSNNNTIDLYREYRGNKLQALIKTVVRNLQTDWDMELQFLPLFSSWTGKSITGEVFFLTRRMMYPWVYYNNAKDFQLLVSR